MKGLIKSSIILTVVGMLFLTSCSDEPTQVLEKKINVSIRSGNNIDAKEWNELTKYIIDNKAEFPDLVDGETVNTKKLTGYILAFSQQHNRRGQTDPEILSPKSDEASIKPIVKVFVENSISMDGYVTGNSDFKSDLTEMLVLTKNYVGESNIKINFINRRPYASSKKDIANFASKLEPNSITYNVGGKDRRKSDINNIFRMLLDSLHQNEIVILTSDCIYSLGEGDETEGKLNIQKSLTHDAFNDALKLRKNDLATVCLKMASDFKGNYYDLNDHPTKINEKRPYYIWIIGSEDLIKEYYPKITKNMVGIENSYFLSNFTKEKQPFFTVLKETNKVGSFKQTDRGEKEVNSINDIKYDNGTLQFAIAIDLGNIPVDSTYLTNPKSYVVPDGFVVKSIFKIDRNKLTQRDMVIVEKTSATHYITISTTNKFTVQDLKLELSNKIPAWVEASNSIDDRNVKDELDKTFGLSYLVQGVSEAYATQNPEQTSYFKINVSILKGKKSEIGFSSVIITAFTILIVFAFLFAIIALIKKRKEN